VSGFVVEDRGPIGIGGRRLFGVEIPVEPDEPMMVEVPEDELEAIPANGPPAPLDKEKIVAYLANGGLVSLFRGHPLSPVWLCRDTLGNVTHTFIPSRGLIGGKPIPHSALHDGRIFVGKKGEVAEFLESFGLKPDDATRIIAAVGVSS
jgi:hypothetical protein